MKECMEGSRTECKREEGYQGSNSRFCGAQSQVMSHQTIGGDTTRPL